MAAGLLLLLTCCAIASLDGKRTGRFSLLNWAVLGIGAVYGLTWAIVVYVTELDENPLWSLWLVPAKPLYLLHTLSAIVLLAGLWLGWVVLRVGMKRKSAILSTEISRNSMGYLPAGLWFLVIAASVTLWLYSQALGGLIAALDYSAAIRSASFGDTNPFAFLRPFGGLAFFASFGFFGMWLEGNRKISVKFGFLVSLIVSLYVHYSNLGRVGFLIYLLTFVLAICIFKRVKPRNLLLVSAIGMIVLLGGVYWVSALMELKTADGILSYLANELSFPFASFFGQLEAGRNLSRGFIDIFISPVYLLPSSWWVGMVDEVSRVNTELILGAAKGERGVTGGIPVDLMTLGLMQAQIFGVFGVGALFGALLGVLQRFIDQLSNAGIRAILEAYIVLKICIISISYAQPALFISGNVDLFVSCVIMLTCLNMGRGRKKARNTARLARN